MAQQTITREIVRSTFRTEFLERLSIDELCSLLDQEKEYNRTLPHGEQLRHYFSGLSMRDLSVLAGRARARMEEETDVLARFLELKLDPFVEDLRSLEFPFDVHFVTENEIHHKTAAGVRSKACYTAGKIYFGGDPPDLKERVYQVASRGMLGNDLFHEVFHGYQDNGDSEVFWSLEDVLGAIARAEEEESRVALAEAHAWLCTLRGFKDDILIHAIKTSYSFQSSRYLDSAFNILRDLSSLGLSDVEVGQLVGQTRWDKFSGSYVFMESTRDDILTSRNKSRERLAVKVAKHKLIERILAIRAVGIVREICAEGIHASSLAAFPVYAT